MVKRAKVKQGSTQEQTGMMQTQVNLELSSENERYPT